jgi:hypothetical protein
MQKAVSEILNDIDQLKTKQSKIKALQDNKSVLFPIFHYALHPKCTWELPESDPPYKPVDKNADQQARLVSEYKRFYIFIKGNSEVKQVKRERLFIDLLESVDPDDAKLLLHIKNKSLPYKTIDVKLIKSAFPDETRDW